MPVVSSNITAKYLGCGEVKELRHRSEKLLKLNDILEHNSKLEHDPNTNYDRAAGTCHDRTDVQFTSKRVINSISNHYHNHVNNRDYEDPHSDEDHKKRSADGAEQEGALPLEELKEKDATFEEVEY